MPQYELFLGLPTQSKNKFIRPFRDQGQGQPNKGGIKMLIEVNLTEADKEQIKEKVRTDVKDIIIGRVADAAFAEIDRNISVYLQKHIQENYGSVKAMVMDRVDHILLKCTNFALEQIHNEARMIQEARLSLIHI